MNKISSTPIGERIKFWRDKKGISQFDLAMECDTSAKHLSFVETGRATANRELLLRLFTALEVPLEVTNNLLISAGFAPSYQGTGLTSEKFEQCFELLKQTIMSQNKPAVITQNFGEITVMNDAFIALCQRYNVNEQLYTSPKANLLTLLVHPQGFIAYVKEPSLFFQTVFNRLKRLCAVIDDDALTNEMINEISAYAPCLEDIDAVLKPEIMLSMPLVKDELTEDYLLTTLMLGDPLNVIFQECQAEVFSLLS